MGRIAFFGLCSILGVLLCTMPATAQNVPKPKAGGPPEPEVFAGFGAVALSRDGKWIATAGDPDTVVRLSNVETGKLIREFGGHDSRVGSVYLARDGKRLFTADHRGIYVWEVASGKQLARIPTPFDYQLSGDEKWLVIHDKSPEDINDKRIVRAAVQLWNLETGKKGQRCEIVRANNSAFWRDYTLQSAKFVLGFMPRFDDIVSTALSHDGSRLVTGPTAGLGILWDTSTGKEIRTVGRSTDFRVGSAAFSKDGKWLATTHTLSGEKLVEVVRVWDLTTGEEKHAINGLLFSDANFVHDGKWLLTGSDDHAMNIWDTATGKAVQAFRGHKRSVWRLNVSADEKRLASYDELGVARLWEMATGKELRAFDIQPRPKRVDISADSKLLVASAKFLITVWNLETGKNVRSIERKIDY